MNKYEFTGEFIEFHGVILHRIRAIYNFGRIKAGELGGWIEKEENLSQYFNCWVSGEAKVYGNARVFENSWIGGNAIVKW